jgi:hypothetical protein
MLAPDGEKDSLSPALPSVPRTDKPPGSLERLTVAWWSQSYAQKAEPDEENSNSREIALLGVTRLEC